jgi:ABC-2 type transport system permease protein
VLPDTAVRRDAARPDPFPRDPVSRPAVPADGGGLAAPYRVAAIIRHNTILLRREPGPLASRLIMPLGFLALLHPLYEAALGHAAGTRQAVIATVVTFSLLAVSLVGGSLLTERTWHTWQRVRETPIRPAELLAGKAVPAMAVLFAQQALIIGLGMAAFGLAVPDPLLLAVAAGAWTLAMLGLGAAVGVLARSVQELSAIADLGGMILSSLGGAMVPLSALPGWVRHVAPASPGYWAVSAMKAALAGGSAGTLRASAVLTGFALAFGLLAAARAGRGAVRSARM